MKKLLSRAVFMSLGFACGNGLVSACDKPTKTTVTISQQYEVANCDESKAIIDRLEKLVVPVAAKVHDCNEEFEAADARVQELESELSQAETAQTKGMRTLVAFKAVLADKSCTICIGGQTYRRESVAKAMSVQFEKYKALAANAKTISSALVDQKRVAEEIAARVARWVEAEKVLLAEVSQLQEQHANDVDSKLTKDAAKESEIATRLANTVEKMLATAKTAPSESTEQVLVEVDAVLAAEIK